MFIFSNNDIDDFISKHEFSNKWFRGKRVVPVTEPNGRFVTDSNPFMILVTG